MDHVDSNPERDHNTVRGTGPRHSILDLAPLELECLSALWPMGEGTVRDIHRQLSTARPRAYTTVLTIMDRLAQKGIVDRRKVGRAYRYRANLSADEAREKAVEKIVVGFFDGSPEALASHLASNLAAHPAERPASRAPAPRERPRTFPAPVRAPIPSVVDAPDAAEGESSTRPLDDTLL